MTRTIYVVFNNDYRLNRKCVESPKEYKFLCNYDIVKVGDEIRDPRYTSIMTVTRISSSNKRIQEGLSLKDIFITHMNGGVLLQPSGLVNGSIAGSDYDIDLIRSKEPKYLEEGNKIHCSTPEEARKVIDIYYTLGYKWGNSKKEETNYSYYHSKTVYSLDGIGERTIKIGSIDTSKALGKNIIPAKEFIDYYTTKDMEKRNLKVTLEQAIEWYNSGNTTLRTLALTVFTEEELTLNLDYIKKTVISTCFRIDVPYSDASKYEALSNLAIIAKYFNGDWKKTPSNTGYFLGQSNLKFSNSSNIDNIKGLRNIGIVEHNTVMYPGIVYFKEKEDLIKAVKIMGDKVKDLFS